MNVIRDFLLASALAATMLFAPASSAAQSPTEARLPWIEGSDGVLAYRFGLDWSDAQRFSLVGGYGYRIGETAALGVALRAGTHVNEGLVNLGFALSNNRLLVVTGGQMRENLTFGNGVGREWIAQNEFGIALSGGRLDAHAFFIDSESGTNFIGTRSFGAALSSRFDMSDRTTVSGSFGYQNLEFDDTTPRVERATAGLDITYAASGNLAFHAGAHRGVTESRYRIGARWRLERGTLTASYMRVASTLGPQGDEERFRIALSVPIGARTGPRGASDPDRSGSDRARMARLLAEVIRRPDYLPQSVAVRPAIGGCPPEAAVGSARVVGSWENVNDGSGVVGVAITTPSAADFGVYSFYFEDPGNGGQLTPIAGGSNIVVAMPVLQYNDPSDWLYAHYLANGDNAIFALGGAPGTCEFVVWAGD